MKVGDKNLFGVVGGDRQLAQLIQSIKAKHIANNCLLFVCERLFSLVSSEAS